MHRVKILASLLALALLVTGAAFGQATLTKYVALGDSLTAGFSSGSINSTYQSTSYPALLAKQFGIASFQQPLVSPPGLPGILQLTRLVPTPVIAPTPGAGTPTNLNYPFPYDNMAVPGATVHDLLTKTRSTSANDPTDLILRQLGFTQLQQGLSLRPTFVTLWIGNNDALGSATAGTDQLLTPLASFEADYKTIVGAIAASGAKMAIANIPDVTTIPFVTTLTRFIPNPATGQPAVINGNFVPLLGPDGPLQPGDFVLLTATSELALGRGIPVALGGSGIPLSNSVVLNASEAANVRARVNAVQRRHRGGRQPGRRRPGRRQLAAHQAGHDRRQRRRHHLHQRLPEGRHVLLRRRPPDEVRLRLHRQPLHRRHQRQVRQRRGGGQPLPVRLRLVRRQLVGAGRRRAVRVRSSFHLHPRGEA